MCLPKANFTMKSYQSFLLKLSQNIYRKLLSSFVTGSMSGASQTSLGPGRNLPGIELTVLCRCSQGGGINSASPTYKLCWWSIRRHTGVPIDGRSRCGPLDQFTMLWSCATSQVWMVCDSGVKHLGPLSSQWDRICGSCQHGSSCWEDW